MKTVAAIVASVAFIGTGSSAQTAPIPIRTLSAATRTGEHFEEIPSLRVLGDGRLLVNDRRRERLLLFDSLLTSFTIVAGVSSVPGVPYPPSTFGGRLVPYLGDSTLIGDLSAQGFVMIDPGGKLTRALAHPKPRDLTGSSSSQGVPGIDTKGRLIYRASTVARPAQPHGDQASPPSRDTIRIVRADFETRRIDTVGSYTVPRAEPPHFVDGSNGKTTATMKLMPVLPAPDEWAVLSDGTIAILRGQDYHIDWVRVDGTTSSSPKMPFDWRRLTDDEKQRKIDSARKIVDSIVASGRPYATYYRPHPAAPGIPSKLDTIVPTLIWASPSELPDYTPPIRTGAVIPDLDGNLWILPTTSLQARGGLLYDVVNGNGAIFMRVQLPHDRVVAGFGRGGVVFLAVYDGAAGWVLERAHLDK